MGRLVVGPTSVTYRMSTLEHVLSLRGDVVVPRAAVASVRAVADAWSQVRGWRAPGYGMPRHRKLGTWRHDGVKDFVDVRYGAPGVVMELRDPSLARLVLTVDDPASVVDQLA